LDADTDCEGEALRLLLALAVSEDDAVWEGVCSAEEERRQNDSVRDGCHESQEQSRRALSRAAAALL